MNDSRLVTRREMIVGGAAALGSLLLTGCSDELPPTYGHLLRMGDALTFAAHRTLLSGRALAREYTRRDITSFPATGTTDPGDTPDPKAGEAYRAWQAAAFANWRLAIEGLVAHPGTYSLADLKRFPARTQITRHQCEEGWSAIGEWTGVPLRTVLEAAGLLPHGLDMVDVLHPQTILAYGMNGRDLPIAHGAPLRLRVETQLGYKSMKYVQRIVVKDRFDDGGKDGNIQNGWSWYAGI